MLLQVCFIVSKSININIQECHKIYRDIVALTLNIVHSSINIVNMYNPKPTIPCSQTPLRLGDIQQTIQKSATTKRELILLDNFNLHYSWQGGAFAILDNLGEDLLAITKENNIDLVLLQGSIIQQQDKQTSTIDLTFISILLSNCIQPLSRIDLDTQLYPYTSKTRCQLLQHQCFTIVHY